MGIDHAPRLAFAVTSHATAAGFLPGLTGHLAAAGWEVTVICAPPDGPARMHLPDGVRMVEVPMERDPAAGADVRSVAALWRVLRDLQPAVVVTATPKASLLVTLVARLRRVPLVVHLMWGLRSQTLRGPARMIVRALESVATRLSHRVVPNSASLGAELRRLRMVRPERMAVLGAGSSHGVDLERFRPDGPSGADDVTRLLDGLGDGPVIGFVGRITADKGVADLLDAVATLNGAGRKCRLMLAGAVEDEALAGRVATDAARGVPVVALGPRTDTAALYRLMDVHCLPSLREGFPNVCLEASACGVPTVTTDATGAIDSVVDGETGLIARRGDPASLAGALGALLDDAPRRARMGASARRWVEREFPASLVWRRHERFLRDAWEACR